MVVNPAYVRVGEIPALRVRGLTQTHCPLHRNPLGSSSPASHQDLGVQCLFSTPQPAEAAQNRTPLRRHLLSLHSSCAVLGLCIAARMWLAAGPVTDTGPLHLCLSALLVNPTACARTRH